MKLKLRDIIAFLVFAIAVYLIRFSVSIGSEFTSNEVLKFLNGKR